ncbi:HAD family hydrolase [Chengkuizengella marina]|uniref:HAD family hydrolase n=1 Tax=Chengkuizengella marina TaxID=2507566 RepID=A0A6N9Q4C3_9BACL|nr:HAD family hydrolase [Chengkuizengella marina]NBI29676.1 HAD family hydrolase [Chengkuizengella marina]
MISAVVLDLDGTFLNSNKEISHRNMDAVMTCIKHDIKIIIATARPPRSVKKFVPEVMMKNCSFVFYNGGYIIDNSYKEHIYISKKLSAEIIHYCLTISPKCHLSIELEDKWFSNKGISDVDAAFFNIDTSPIVLSMDELKQLEATKIIMTGFNNIDQLKERFNGRVKIVATDEGELIQIMNKNVSKATGISTLCTRNGLQMSDVMVFGDDYNDIEMFKECGYCVAVENAIDELKKIANEVTLSNDQDG